MRQSKSPLRGSVTQNRVSCARVREEDGIGFLARLGILAGVLLLVLIVAVVGWRSGWPQEKVEQIQKDALDLTNDARFSVRDIVVEGRVQSGKDEISDALGIKQGTPILSVDTDAAAERIGKLPWVASVIIERRLPDTITVLIKERKPIARWQRDQKLSVIDDEGHLIPTAKPEDFPALPLIVGTGAERQAQPLLTALKDYPDIREKMESAVRVGDRRWDLHLLRKIVVRLPESALDNALRRLSVLIAEEKILERNIVAIDLRLSDRLVLEPAEEPKPSGEKKP